MAQEFFRVICVDVIGAASGSAQSAPKGQGGAIPACTEGWPGGSPR